MEPEELEGTESGAEGRIPRPAYQDDPERVYAFEFGGKHVRFRVEGGFV